MPALPSHFARCPRPACAELTLSTLRSGSCVTLGSLVATATHWLKIQHLKFIIKHRGLRPPLVAAETLLVSAWKT